MALRWILACALFSLFSSPLYAEDFLVSISKKQEDKYKNRWTLADWFSDQHKIRLQDMWLAGHTRENIYEFFLGGSNFSGDFKNSISGSNLSNRSSVSLGAYATIAGIEVQYFDRNNTLVVGNITQFKLRILGSSMQNTSLFVGYGQKQFSSAGIDYTNNLYSIQLSLYLTKRFGVLFDYLESLPGAYAGGEYSDNQTESQLFLDFGPLRIFGSSVLGTQTFKGTVSTTTNTISGINAGAKLFF